MPLDSIFNQEQNTIWAPPEVQQAGRSAVVHRYDPFSAVEEDEDEENVRPSITRGILNAAKALTREFATSSAVNFMDSVAIATTKLDEWFGSRGWDKHGDPRELDEVGIYHLARFVQGLGERYLGSDPDLQESFLANVLPGAVGQGAGFIAGGMALKAPRLFSGIAGASQAAATGYHEAISRGATEDQAFQRFVAGLGIGASQAIPIGNFFRRAEKATGPILKNAVIEAARQGRDEAVQELFQTVAENIATFIIYDDEQGFWEGIVPNTTTGMSAGAILGFSASAILGRRIRANAIQAGQNVQDVAGLSDNPAGYMEADPSTPGGPVISVEEGGDVRTLDAAEATESLQYWEAPLDATPTTTDPMITPDPAMDPMAHLDPQQELDPNAAEHVADTLSDSRLDDPATLDYLQTFGLSKAHVTHIRQSIGLDELPAGAKRTWIRVILEAAKTGAGRKIDADTAGLLKHPRPISDIEYAGLVIRAADVFLQREQTVAAQYQAQQEGNFVESKRLAETVGLFDKALDTYTQVSDVTGSETGRALAIRRLQIAPDRFSLDKVLRDAAIKKQTALTDTEVAALTQEVENYQAVEGKIKSLEDNFDAKLEEHFARQAEAEIAKHAKTKSSKESTAQERERLKKELQQLGLRLNDLTGVSAEGVYKLGQYALTFAKDGVTDLGQIVAKMQQQLPSLSARDVYQAITAQNPARKSAARKRTKTHIRNLKKQADILLELDDALNGIFRAPKAKTPTQHNTLVKAVRKKITELKKDAFKTQHESEQLGRVLDKITRLEKELGIIGPGALDIDTARNTLSDLRSLMRTREQISEMETQMREGSFRSAWTPPKRPVLPELKAARLEKEIMQRQLRARVAALEPFKYRDFRNLGEDRYDAFKAAAKIQVPQYVQLPRTLLATADMSYALRQGLLLSVTRPGVAGKTFYTAFRSMINKDFAITVDMEMRNDPMHILREKYGLYIAPVEGGRVTDVEEAFVSRVAHNIPVFGSIIRASERNMTVGLNMLRAAAFDQFVAQHRGNLSDDAFKAYANYVNAASGRGKMDAKVARAASYVFFAPRFAYSRFTAPAHMVKYWEHKEVRKAMAQDWIGLGIAGNLFLALAQAGGAIVGYDPRDSDFGRIVIGNTRIDIWGSFQGPARLIMNLGISAADERGLLEGLDSMARTSGLPQDMFGLTSQFLTYKLSPAVTIPTELLRGKNVINQDVTFSETAARSVVPLMFQEVYDGWKNDGVTGGILGSTELIGLSSAARDNPLHRGETKRLLRRADYRPAFGRYPDGADRALKREMKKTFEERMAYELEMRFGYLDGLPADRAKEELQDLRSRARVETLRMHGFTPPPPRRTGQQRNLLGGSPF